LQDENNKSVRENSNPRRNTTPNCALVHISDKKNKNIRCKMTKKIGSLIISFCVCEEEYCVKNKVDFFKIF